ncbi:MAG: alginate export family protein [Acidobacteria bacterium]|nr:alginate export family protein [Acidobacteriota bacterium]NIM61585.1 alginate export family protein [Acidobacteriota bacterium]NIO58149.1 alginate export family protein [Acidobacteriota bacterium]NIQ29165.1 alginate export family protein [Acidobacteriota bacterium]NIQ85077.1 alginate export family protein [Acidobacteriota bacterium]
MKRMVCLSLLLAGALILPAPVLADDDKVTITGEAFARTEYLDDFDDFDSNAGRSWDFSTYRIRIGLDFELTDNIDAFAQVQAHGLWGDSEFRASGDPAGGAVGQAPFDNDSLLLYQAYVNLNDLADGPVSLRIGRQEHVLGNELHLGDNSFYNGQFFDGVRAMIDLEKTDLDIFFYNVEERDITADFGGVPGSNDTKLGGVTANFEVAEDQKIEPYVLYYHDGSPAGPASYELYTVGALYMRPADDDRKFDWSVEAAFQKGDVNDPSACPGGTPCDLKSSIFEGWFGYSWGDDSRHRVHVGALAIGDGDDPVDAEFFMSIAPDTHRRAGAMDLFTEGPGTSFLGTDSFHNLTTYNVGYAFTGERHGVSATYHDFTLTEDFGAPADELGQEIDVIYNFKLKEKVGFELGVAQFMPDDVFVAPADDDPFRVWAMMKIGK